MMRKHITRLDYSIVNQYGKEVGYGYKYIRSSYYSETAKKIKKFKDDYNLSHKRNKMIIQGSDTITYNTDDSKSRYFKR